MLANLIQHNTVTNNNKKGNCHVQTYSLSNGLKIFKDKGKQAARAEIEQLHNREVFEPIFPQEITQQEKTKQSNEKLNLPN